jgi:hypothetical protein
MFFTKRYKSPKERIKRKVSSENLLEDSDSDDRHSSQAFIDSSKRPKERRLLIILIALCLAFYSSLELAHFWFSSTYYQFIALRIPAPKAAEILSVMATSYTIGRGISSFIAIKIKPKVMIIYHYCIIIIAMTVLYLGQNSIELIWFGNVIIGKYLINFIFFYRIFKKKLNTN